MFSCVFLWQTEHSILHYVGHPSLGGVLYFSSVTFLEIPNTTI